MTKDKIEEWFSTKTEENKKRNLLEILIDNKLIVFTVLFFITIVLVMSSFIVVNKPEVSGTIYSKDYNRERLRYFLDTREVEGSYEYSLLHHKEGENFILKIKRPSKKNPDELIRYEVYVSEETYNKFDIGDYFEIDLKKRKDSLEDKNDTSGRITGWSKEKPNMEEWKEKEY